MINRYYYRKIAIRTLIINVLYTKPTTKVSKCVNNNHNNRVHLFIYLYLVHFLVNKFTTKNCLAVIFKPFHLLLTFYLCFLFSMFWQIFAFINAVFSNCMSLWFDVSNISIMFLFFSVFLLLLDRWDIRRSCVPHREIYVCTFAILNFI